LMITKVAKLLKAFSTTAKQTPLAST